MSGEKKPVCAVVGVGPGHGICGRPEFTSVSSSSTVWSISPPPGCACQTSRTASAFNLRTLRKRPCASPSSDPPRGLSRSRYAPSESRGD